MLTGRFYALLNNRLAHYCRTPRYIILFVSNKCWMSCRHCWYNEAWKTSNIKDTALSFQELESLAGSIKAITFLSLTGGEAFLRDDIVEIASLFARKTRLSRYEIPTSGYDTELIVSRTERLLKANRNIPFRVDVSLDGSEATHDYIRRVKGSYHSALKTITELNRLKKAYSRFDVGVITTISHYNENEVPVIGQIVEAVNPDGEWMVNITRGNPRDAQAASVDPEKYFQAHKIIAARIQSNRYRGHSGHFLAPWLTAKNATRRKVIKSILDGHYTGGVCTAGSLGGVIYNDGTVAPCELLKQKFGNLRDVNYNLPGLWLSPDADSIRAGIQQSFCRCTQECFLSTSLLLQPPYVLDIIRERMRLYKWKTSF